MTSSAGLHPALTTLAPSPPTFFLAQICTQCLSSVSTASSAVNSFYTPLSVLCFSGPSLQPLSGNFMFIHTMCIFAGSLLASFQASLSQTASRPSPEPDSPEDIQYVDLRA